MRFYLLLLIASSFFELHAQVNTTQVMQMGRAALYYDDYVTAINYFNTVLGAKPYLSDAYYYRAYAKFSLEDYESAERDLDQAVLFNPFRVEYYQLRGLCRIHNDNSQGAIDDYDRTLQELPEDQSAHYNRVLCRMELKDYVRANDELDVILNKWPKFTRAYLVKAQACLQVNDTLKSLFWVDSLLVISPREPAAWAFKGRYAREHEDFLQADSCFTQALKYDAGNVDYHLERAQVRHALNRYNLALNDYDRIIEMLPQHFVAHYNRGLIRSTIGDDNRAIDDFTFVINEEPDNTLAIYNRAELRKRVGDYRGAVSDYSVLLRAYPKFLYGYAQRADCYRALGEIRKAQRDEACVQSAQMDLFYNRSTSKGGVKAVRRRSDHELDRYDQLVEEDADTTRSYFSEFAGKVQNRKVERVFLPAFQVEGNYFVVEGGQHPIYITDEHLQQLLLHISQLPAEEMLEALRESVEKYPQEAVLHYNLACAEADGGSLESALDEFSRAISQDAQMAEAYYNKAVVFLLLGDNEKAAPLLSKSGEMGLFKAYNLLKQAKSKP